MCASVANVKPPVLMMLSLTICRPCEQACGVKAIGSDEQGRASILEDKCVSCGMCMVSCPFGAISDKSQIFQLAHALRDGDKIIAIVAPAYIGQFGDDVTPGKIQDSSAGSWFF